MRVLVLGGTQFVGRHIVEALLAAGHFVSIFNRGQTPDELPGSVERLRGDRDEGASGLAALAGLSWDACVDVSGYTPRQVRPSAETLRAHVERYIFVSAVSVYGDPRVRPVVETLPRLPPAAENVTEVDGLTYGPLKVACEDIVQEIYAERSTLLRPQVIAGPYDPSGRFPYWIERAGRAGAMLAPGDGADHVQVIDARDLARFVATVIENDLPGVFNLAGPRVAWADFLRLLGAKDLVWVSAEILEAAGVTFHELPLFRPEQGARSGLMDVSSERARAAGLTLSELDVTVRDVRGWSVGRELPLLLSAERERELIEACYFERRS